MPESTVLTSVDAIFDGRVLLEQPRRGYRFTIDSLAVAARVARHDAAHVLDVGAGVGAIALAAAVLSPAIERLDAVEVDAVSAALLADNIERNALQSRVVAHHADFRQWARGPGAGRRYGVIAINPPYFSPSSSRASADSQRAASRHELHGGIEHIVAAAAPLLARRGAVELVYPARSLGRLLGALEQAGLRRVALRPVHAVEGREAYVVLATAQPGRESIVTLEPALVLADASRVATPEARALASGERTSHPVAAS